MDVKAKYQTDHQVGDQTRVATVEQPAPASLHRAASFGESIWLVGWTLETRGGAWFIGPDILKPGPSLHLTGRDALIASQVNRSAVALDEEQAHQARVLMDGVRTHVTLPEPDAPAGHELHERVTRVAQGPEVLHWSYSVLRHGTAIEEGSQQVPLASLSAALRDIVEAFEAYVVELVSTRCAEVD